MRIALDRKVVDKLLSLPETGMGYQLIDVLLANGRRVEGLMALDASELVVPEHMAPDDFRTIEDVTLSKRRRTRDQL